MNNEKNFTFAVLVYNHEQYVIEHLESIKFLINEYGKKWNFTLVISDDGSTDNSLPLIHYWLSLNPKLFLNVYFEGDGYNHGVCISYTNISKYIHNDYYKILAGDDLYSGYNLFIDRELLDNNDYVSGVPLTLIDGRLERSSVNTFNILATDRLYKDKFFVDRLKYISVMNTPSLMYSSKFLNNSVVIDYIKTFQVTEDFPMIEKISEIYPTVKFKQTKNVHVYYRRTKGSIYIVQNSKFNQDKLRVFNSLLCKEEKFLDRFLLKNRIYCYLLTNRFFKKALNLNYYLYVIRILVKLPLIINDFVNLDINIKLHRKHLKKIQIDAQAIIDNFNKKKEGNK